MLCAALAFVAMPAAYVAGCNTTQQSIAVKTLGSVHSTADAAYSAYVSHVLATHETNGVPVVANAYREFQTAFSLALVAVAGNTNVAVPQPVFDAAAKLTTTINQAKGAK